MIPREMKKKVCLVGDPAVGKTSTIRRFVHSEFDEKYISTMGANISKKQIQVPFQTPEGPQPVLLTMSIWDLVGQKSFRNLTTRHFENSDGALMVADGTRKDSLWSIREWIASLFNTTGIIPVILLVNKYDLMQEGDPEHVTVPEIEQVAADHQLTYLFTSARTGENVDAAFQGIGEAMLQVTLRQDAANTPHAVCQEILKSFIGLHGGEEAGLPIARHQFKTAGTDVDDPTKEGLLKAIPNLLAVTERLKGPQVAALEKQKYMRLMKRLD